MIAYLLLRDNKQSGPYSLEELKSIGIRSSDLLWIEGKSTSWCFPDEIEDLLAFVHASPISNRHSSNSSVDIEHQGNGNQSFRYENRNEQRSTLPIEKKSKPAIEKDTESEQISKRNIELRKNIFNRREPENFSPVQNDENKNQETGSYNFSLPNIIKVIVADDHRLFREGVKTALAQKNEIKIIGEAENGMQLLNLLKHNRPDVILLDIQMPVMDGISALASIRKLYADMKVIILSMHEGHSMVSTLMEAGANGYLTKTADPETIYQAIKTCYEKNYYFSDLTNVSMLEGLRSKKKIPEKISTTVFDGGEMMQRLAVAQKKSSNYSLPKTQKNMLVAAGTILLISVGVMAGKTIIMGRSIKEEVPITITPNTPASSTLPPLVPQSALTDSSKNQAIDSLKQSADTLQKKTDEEIVSQEKMNAKKDILEKHATKKLKDSVKSPTVLVIQKIDSSVNIKNDVPAKKMISTSPDLKAIARSSIRNLISASANDYHVAAFGGLSDIEITVNNHSSYAIDEVSVEVQYVLSNSKIYKKEILSFQNIPSGSSQILKAPKSSRGQKIDYKIGSIKSKDLDLE